MRLTTSTVLKYVENGDYIRQQLDDKNMLFNMYERFYLGTQYNSEFIKRHFELYASTRQFYSLISRAVDIDVSLIPGDWASTNTQVDEILINSDWSRLGELYVHYGCVFGEVYLKCYDDGDTTRIQPLNPSGVWLDNNKGIIIRNAVDEAGREYEYAEILTPATISVYKDSKLISQQPNPFNVIPLVYVRNKDVGLTIGLNSFHNVLEEINAVNESVTFLQEQVLRSLIAQKVVSGATPGQIDFGNDKTIFVPKDATVDTLDTKIEIAGTLELIKDIKNEVKNSLPELAIDKATNINLERPTSAQAIELQLYELVMKIKRARKNYDAGLKEAVNLARVLSNQAPLEFDFIERPIIDLVNGVTNVQS